MLLLSSDVMLAFPEDIHGHLGIEAAIFKHIVLVDPNVLTGRILVCLTDYIEILIDIVNPLVG